MNAAICLQPINIVQLENYRQKLLQMQRQLTVAVENITAGDASNAQLLVNQTLSPQTQLQAVINALIRTDRGNFGLCFSCDEMITEVRLNFDPTATNCIRCSTKES